ncbi:hypothetical protein [Clavibacter zhangzhiyongii]|uniref:hypothetical protein n=1 Tax=Clavibacter zhangzhiyongii TaxID=2768071 RepID=UPI0039E1D7D1
MTQLQDSAQLTDRSQFEDTYANGDGTSSAVLSQTPLNVQDEAGDWVPVNTDVSVRPSGSAAVADHPSLRASPTPPPTTACSPSTMTGTCSGTRSTARPTARWSDRAPTR